MGRNSTIELASMDFPVPGSPISITCLLCDAAFLMTFTAASWPMTLSAIMSGISTSSVDLNSSFTIHSSTGAMDSADDCCLLSSHIFLPLRAKRPSIYNLSRTRV